MTEDIRVKKEYERHFGITILKPIHLTNYFALANLG